MPQHIQGGGLAARPLPPTPTPSIIDQILAAKTKVRAEMPAVANVPVEPMGGLDSLIASAKEKLVGGGSSVAALAHPSGGILNSGGPGAVAYDPQVLAQMSQGSREDTVAHELRHIQQNHEDYDGKGLIARLLQRYQDFKESRLPYGQQPHELDAYQFEGDRAVREGRTPDPTPNFLSPGLREKGSYVLMPSRK